MDVFEYKVEIIIPVTKNKILDICNKLGKEGWEAVSLDDGYLLFKRKKEVQS